MVCLVDSVIHFLNNRGQEDRIQLLTLLSTQGKERSWQSKKNITEGMNRGTQIHRPVLFFGHEYVNKPLFSLKSKSALLENFVSYSFTATEGKCCIFHANCLGSFVSTV